MKTLESFWNYLDGKKTNIGAAITTAVGFLYAFNSVVLIGYWHLIGIPYLDPICKSALWIAGAFCGTGLVHQGAKNFAATGSAFTKPQTVPTLPPDVKTDAPVVAPAATAQPIVTN